MTSWVRRGTLVLAGAVVVLGLLAWMLRPVSVAVELVPVSEGPLEVAVRDEGETRVCDRYVVTAPVAGT